MYTHTHTRTHTQNADKDADCSTLHCITLKDTATHCNPLEKNTNVEEKENTKMERKTAEEEE